MANEQKKRPRMPPQKRPSWYPRQQREQGRTRVYRPCVGSVIAAAPIEEPRAPTGPEGGESVTSGWTHREQLERIVSLLEKSGS